MNRDKKTKVSQTRLTVGLIVVIGFFLGTIIYIVNQVMTKDTTPKKTIVAATDIDTQESEEEQAESSLCVIKAVDTAAQTMILYDVDRDCTVKLAFSGGTDIRDKYSQVIAASQLIVGNMADAVYEESTQTLISLMNSPDTWEYTNVTGLNPDRVNKVIKLYGDKYRYTSKLYVRDVDGEIALLSINSDDVLTVRGNGKMIYSITVTKGHGSLILENCEYFEGGTITIAGKEYTEFSSDMVFTVREGKATIQIQKDDIDESMTVEVIRNQEVLVDLSPYAPNPEEKGEVTFLIEPFGAELFIDDSLTSYANPIEMTYGEHTIEVVLDGYETYSSAYVLGVSTDIVQISLSQTVADEDTEDETDETEENSSDSTSDTSGSTTTSGSTGSSTGTSQSTTSSNTSENTSSSSSDTTEEETETSSVVDSEHTIAINSPTGVSVYINGVYKGIAPVTIEKPLGVTYITLLKEGYEQITHTVNIKDDDEDKYYTFPNLVLIEEDDEEE